MVDPSKETEYIGYLPMRCYYTSLSLRKHGLFEGLSSLAGREGDEVTGGSSEDNEEGCGMLLALFRLLGGTEAAASSLMGIAA